MMILLMSLDHVSSGSATDHLSAIHRHSPIFRYVRQAGTFEEHRTVSRWLQIECECFGLQVQDRMRIRSDKIDAKDETRKKTRESMKVNKRCLQGKRMSRLSRYRVVFE